MRNNLSTLAYQVKPKENVGKITFQEHDNLNVAQTLALLCMGRCLCANEKGNTNKLYTYNEIISSDEFQEFDMNDVEEKEVKHAHKAKKTAKNRENVPFIDFNMIKSFLEDSDAVFFEKYRESYYRGWVNYRYEKADEWLLSPDSLISYQYTDENYFALPYYIHNGHFSESSSESIKNWFMRELAISMLINQGCDINRVAYRLLLKIREQNVDSEGLLDQHTIIGAMECAATMTTQEIEERYEERLSFLRKVSKLKSGIIIRKNKANRLIGYSTLVSQIKKELVLSVVSGMETPKEAFQIVSEKFPRLNFTLKWVQTFFTEMSFCTEKKMTQVGIELRAIRELLEEDKNLSVRKLSALLKERKGISIGRSTLHRRLKELQNCN